MTLKPGLVSVTFRSLSVDEVIEAARSAGLAGIEWGGDVHVPHGQVALARDVARRTREAGLEVSSYGSYYRYNEADVPFTTVLATASALGAPVIRVWAGQQGSAEVDAAEWDRIVVESRRIGSEAEELGIRVCYEFHGNTLTDTNDTAERLLREVDHPNVRTFWQPPNGKSEDYRIAGLKAVSPWLEYLHCFYWTGEPRERRPLSEGQKRWATYLATARAVEDGLDPRWVLLEFVPDDSLASLYRDAATLTGWLAG
jgi:3-dehydroshikimate dehydratase